MRFQWFAMPSLDRICLKSIVDGMGRSTYTEKNGAGYVLETVRPGEVQGRFIKRVLVEERFSDPYGEEQVVKYDRYQVARFRVSLDLPQLEIIDPPRSAGDFLKSLKDLMPTGIALKPLDTSVANWIEAFKDAETAVTVTKLTTDQVSINREVSFRAEMTGVTDVRSAAQGYFQKELPASMIAGEFVVRKRKKDEKVRFKLTARCFHLLAESDRTVQAVIREVAKFAAAKCFNAAEGSDPAPPLDDPPLSSFLPGSYERPASCDTARTILPPRPATGCWLNPNS